MKLRVDELRMGKIIWDILFMDDYLTKDGKEDRRIKNSPHFKLLRSYERNPHLDLRRTDYYRFARERQHYFGTWFGRKEKEGILQQMRGFLALYERIRREGFDYGKGRIVVYRATAHARRRDSLGRPHPPTPTYTPTGYEIYEGHHRAAILAKLGYHSIEVDLLSPWILVKNWFKKHLTRRFSSLSR
ncbi:MAG: hypothetical protein GXP63_02045 [DPANN group archaeon]|nr:hypothetical protein [DPANN group archaeon]